jgi:hypothetical protein
MAEFCKQCTKALFFEDTNDFEGLCGEDEMIQVLCEGCGPTYVDSKGKCIGKCMGHFKQVTKQYSEMMAPSRQLNK